MSFWANVFLGKCLSGQMSFWADVFLGKCLLGKCRSAQMSLGKCLWANFVWANVVWANVGSPYSTLQEMLPFLQVLDGLGGKVVGVVELDGRR
jgi:hypothetical protein